MSYLPKTKGELQDYLAKVDAEIERRKGKLPFFESKEV